MVTISEIEALARKFDDYIRADDFFDLKDEVKKLVRQEEFDTVAQQCERLTKDKG